jgi:hypothetical protein
LDYLMIAERDNEKVQSRRTGVLMAVAKARVWASEGWQVVVTDGNGRTFTPAEFEHLCSFDAGDAGKSRALALLETQMNDTAIPGKSG